MFTSDLMEGLAADCQGTMSQPRKIVGSVLQQHRCEDKRTWLCTPDRCRVCIVISLLQLAGACEPMMQKPCRGMGITVVFLEAVGQKTSFCHLPWAFLHRLLGVLYTAGSSVFNSSQQPKIYIQPSWDPIGRIKHLLCLKDKACGDVHIFFIKVLQDKRKSWNKMLMPSTLD